MSRDKKPLFEDARMFRRIVEIAETWKGTPYRHLTMVKGRGADCSLFIAAIFLEAGILKKVEHDYYPRDWHIHTKDELVVDGFTDHLARNLANGLQGEVYKSPDPESIMIGDILGFSTATTGATNHASLYLGNDTMIHCIQHKGVHEVDYKFFWSEKLTTIFRIFQQWDS